MYCLCSIDTAIEYLQGLDGVEDIVEQLRLRRYYAARDNYNQFKAEAEEFGKWVYHRFQQKESRFKV